MEQARETGDAAHLGARDVAAGAHQDLAAPSRMGEKRDEIGHGSARQEETRLLAGALGAERFETLDRRVAVAGIIAERSPRHGFAHALGRQGHRVAAQIDEGHGECSKIREAKPRSVAAIDRRGQGGLSVMTMRSEAAATAVPAPVPSNAWNMTTVSVCHSPL